MQKEISNLWKENGYQVAFMITSCGWQRDDMNLSGDFYHIQNFGHHFFLSSCRWGSRRGAGNKSGFILSVTIWVAFWSTFNDIFKSNNLQHFTKKAMEGEIWVFHFDIGAGTIWQVTEGVTKKPVCGAWQEPLIIPRWEREPRDGHSLSSLGETPVGVGTVWDILLHSSSPQNKCQAFFQVS